MGENAVFYLLAPFIQDFIYRNKWEELRPIQQKYNELMNDRAYLKQCYTEGAQKARNISHRVLDKAMKKIGFVL